MADSTNSQPDSRTPFQKFEDGLRLGLAAPKDEVNRRMAEDAAKKQKQPTKQKL